MSGYGLGLRLASSARCPTTLPIGSRAGETRTAERCGKTKPTRLSGLRWSTVACKLHVPDRDQLRRVGWWLLNQPERRENQRVAVPPKSQRPPASLSETRARNAGDTSGA